MPGPFIKTSEGWINLSLVTHIGLPDEGGVRFDFIGPQSQGEEGICPDWVTLPVEEGQRVMGWLEANYPDMFKHLD
jgi:hypothetical protein